MVKKIFAVMLALSLAAGSIIPVAPGSVPAVAEAAKKKLPSVKKIRKTVANQYGENYVPDMPLTNDEIKERYGIQPSWYTDIIAEVPMISVNIDTLIVVKAKNKNTRKKVRKQLADYRQDQIDNSLQYPMNALKLQASRVYVKDNYVFFIMLGFVDSSIEQTGTDEEIIEAYKAENQKAVNAINSLFK